MAEKNGGSGGWETGKWVPPYISFSSLAKLWKRLQEEGTPPRIDRSYLDTFSGGYQSQVLATLKSLDLIGKSGEVMPTLTQLAERPDERPSMVAELVKRFYPEPVRLGTLNATQGQLEEAFREYGIAGDTMRKAVSFYLAAAKFGNIQLSKHFRTPSITSADGRTTPRRGRPPKVKSADQEDDGGDNGHLPGATPSDLSHIDPAILAWVRRLPDSSQAWPARQRERWFTALRAITDDIYGEVEEES
jgi:hypothetical protein